MYISLLLALLTLLCSPLLEAKRKPRLSERQLPSWESLSSSKTLLATLDPYSVSQHLAFYYLYPDTKEGKQALQKAWVLLGGEEGKVQIPLAQLPELNIEGIISLVTRASHETGQPLSEEQVAFIENLSKDLLNRGLKGHRIETQYQALRLTSDETDLARTLMLFQMGDSEEAKKQIREYEAQIDLMALQIRPRLGKTPSYEKKIEEINRFIFHEMQFRFPPQSLHAADIDLYTFLPSVLDGRQGVCLGVSILYLALAQRLGLPLEIITPPGHIYVRFNDGSHIINIETTARGIDFPSDTYLGVNTRFLKKRTIKQVVGLAFMNEAATCWSREEYEKAITLYEKARLFMPDDPLLKMFYAFNLFFVGRDPEGETLLEEVNQISFDESVSDETLVEDLLKNQVDAEGIKVVFLSVDETRSSILDKQKRLDQVLNKYPRYRAGLLQLATTWLQLGRMKEAKEVLEKYHQIDPHNVIVEYYLSILCLNRLDFNQAWQHFRHLRSLLLAKEHAPPLLLSLKQTLLRTCPEP